MFQSPTASLGCPDLTNGEAWGFSPPFPLRGGSVSGQAQGTAGAAASASADPSLSRRSLERARTRLETGKSLSRNIEDFCFGCRVEGRMRTLPGRLGNLVWCSRARAPRSRCCFLQPPVSPAPCPAWVDASSGEAEPWSFWMPALADGRDRGATPAISRRAGGPGGREGPLRLPALPAVAVRPPPYPEPPSRSARGAEGFGAGLIYLFLCFFPSEPPLPLQPSPLSPDLMMSCWESDVLLVLV